MTRNLELPESVVEALRDRWGDAWETTTKEGLAVQWYRDGLITSGQVGEMLGIGWFEAQQFLRRHGAGQSWELREVLQDADALRELRER